MAASTRQQFCGDTLNIFGREDQNFQWSRAYSYYSSPPAQKDVIWASGIARVGCVPEVFDCKELVAWCVEKYVPSQRIIQLQDHSLISLSPQVFRKMLKLPEPTLTFKGEDCRDFLKKHNNGLDLLPEYLENPASIPEDITRIQVESFKNPYREIAWLFTRLTGQESTATISRMILYILYFTVKEHAIFDWGKLISIEISSQLSHYKKDKKFFMASYLIFSIVYCCQFPNLTISKRVNHEIDPVTFWYQALWRHKTPLYFYEVYNDFVSVFKRLLLGENTSRISDQANKFLEKKGTIEQMENHSVIRIFCSKENPSFLPYHVSEKLFITEVARQYNFWLHFFHEKRKKQFIPLPWKIGDFMFRNINKIDEFANHFNNVNLKYVEKIKGFDPNKIFVEHMLYMMLDLETLLNTNDFYSKREKVLVKEVLGL
jgi:hypothetical protein